MRKIIFILVSMTLICCRDEGSKENIQEEYSIVGKWKWSKEGTYSGKDLNVKLDENYPNSCEQNDIYEFTSSNKYIGTFYETNSNNECTPAITTKDYVYDKNKKVISFDGDPIDVLELTKDKMIIGWYEGDLNDDGITDYTKVYLYK